MILSNKFIFEEISYYKSLIELAKYCKHNDFYLTRLNEENDDFKFLIEIKKDILLEVTSNVYKRDNGHHLVVLNLEAKARHSKYTKPIEAGVRNVGKLAGGGLGAIISVAIPFIGWISGGAITYCAYQIGKVPSILLENIDNSISNNFFKNHLKDMQAIINLFKDNLIDFSAQEKNYPTWCNTYLLENKEFLYTYSYTQKSRKEKIEKTIKFNDILKEEKKIIFFASNHPSKEYEIVRIKEKDFNAEKVQFNKELEIKLNKEWIIDCIDPIYEQKYKDKYGEATTNGNLAELKASLNNYIKY